MASPPNLDIPALLAPIPGARPAGSPVARPVRVKLDDERKDTEPHPDDPSKDEIPRKVDWAGILRLGKEMLAGSSKDLLLASRMTEALTRLHGFGGLRDGLRLLRELVEQCWDRLHPIPEEDETMAEVRAGPFNWLSDPDSRIHFPNTVRAVPLLAVKNERVSWQDWKSSQTGRGALTEADFANAAPLSADVVEDLAQTAEELGRLDQALFDRLGPGAPGVIGLRQAVEDCKNLMDLVVRRQPAAPAQPSAGPGGNGDATPGSRGPALQAGDTLGRVATRADAYRQLAQIADLLGELEPHSPIPDLLRRAVELGRLPFRELIRELVRDQGQLAELRREFGIKAPPPPEGG